ncbi:hypothetical protein ANN_16986 [Periplaneta americana]|uniref:Uncharacterized protein n=1 Tax=Periplaneta americana TaxID=6978 RepID=A0ABQ8SRM5_PERAM|nr:hypothetical protein ANN_16986 [Periplaneta americana]
MGPGSSTESYPAFAHIGLRENPGKNLNQVTCPDRESNPGHLVSRLDVLTVTPQMMEGIFSSSKPRVVGHVLAIYFLAFVPDWPTRLRTAANIILENPKLTSDLAFIKANFGKLPAYIKKLEARGVLSIEYSVFHSTMLCNKLMAHCLRGVLIVSRPLARYMGKERTSPPAKESVRSRAMASWSKASCLGLALQNARWFESSWGKKFSHEISVSVWDRCPPSIVMHLGSYDR